MQGLRHAGCLRCLLGGSAGVVTGDQDVDFAPDFSGGADGVERRALERRVVVLGDDEDGHVHVGCVVPANAGTQRLWSGVAASPLAR